MADSTDAHTGTGSINTLIHRILLLKVPLYIDNVVLYSWGYNLGTDYLEPKKLYDIDNYQTTILAPSNFKDYHKIGIRGELSQRTFRLFLAPLQQYFILQLHADEILENGYKNLVVTNEKPDKNVFPKDSLHTETGAWKF